MASQLKAFLDLFSSAQLVIVTQKLSKLPHVTFCRNHILNVKVCTWIDSLLLSAPCCIHLGTGLSIKEPLLNKDSSFC